MAAGSECRPSVCLHVTGGVHGLLHVEITLDIELESIYCVFLGKVKKKKYKNSLNFGSACNISTHQKYS